MRLPSAQKRTAGFVPKRSAPATAKYAGTKPSGRFLLYWKGDWKAVPEIGEVLPVVEAMYLVPGANGLAAVDYEQFCKTGNMSCLSSFMRPFQDSGFVFYEESHLAEFPGYENGYCFGHKTQHREGSALIGGTTYLPGWLEPLQGADAVAVDWDNYKRLLDYLFEQNMIEMPSVEELEQWLSTTESTIAYRQAKYNGRDVWSRKAEAKVAVVRKLLDAVQAERFDSLEDLEGAEPEPVQIKTTSKRKTKSEDS